MIWHVLLTPNLAIMMKKWASLSPPLRRWLKCFFVLCLVLALLDIVVNKHGDHWWSFFGFHNLYGFVACVILVLVATAMRRWVMRDEDYYD